MSIRKIGARIRIAGVLLMLVLPAYAQTETPASGEAQSQSDRPGKTESTPNLDTSSKLESSPQLDAAVPTASRIEAFIARLDSTIRAIHENAKDDPALIREGCRALLNDVLDLSAMARATNEEIWEKMTPSQQDLLRAAFEHRMVANCVRQLAQYDGANIRLAGVKPASDGAMLATTRFGAAEGARLVTWRLQKNGAANLRAIDVITEGRSVVSDARNEFAAVLQSVNGDIEALIAFMQK